MHIKYQKLAKSTTSHIPLEIQCKWRGLYLQNFQKSQQQIHGVSMEGIWSNYVIFWMIISSEMGYVELSWWWPWAAVACFCALKSQWGPTQWWHTRKVTHQHLSEYLRERLPRAESNGSIFVPTWYKKKWYRKIEMTIKFVVTYFLPRNFKSLWFGNDPCITLYTTTEQVKLGHILCHVILKLNLLSNLAWWFIRPIGPYHFSPHRHGTTINATIFVAVKSWMDSFSLEMDFALLLILALKFMFGFSTQLGRWMILPSNTDVATVAGR